MDNEPGNGLTGRSGINYAGPALTKSMVQAENLENFHERLITLDAKVAELLKMMSSRADFVFGSLDTGPCYAYRDVMCSMDQLSNLENRVSETISEFNRF